MPEIREAERTYTNKAGRIKEYRYYTCDYVEDGKRRRKNFKLKADAETWVRRFAQRRVDTHDVLKLAIPQINDAVRARGPRGGRSRGPPT